MDKSIAIEAKAEGRRDHRAQLVAVLRRVEGSVEPPTIRHGLVRGNQNHLPIRVGNTQRQDV